MTSPRHVAVLANSRHAETPYDHWVAGTDIELSILVALDKAEGYRHVRAPHTVRVFEDYRHNGNVERAVLELDAERAVEAVVARSEPDILRAARVRDLLGLPGQGWESALAFRDKLVMKRRLAASGVATPVFSALSCGADLCDFVARHGYPVVVKPVLGSGSLDTHVLWGPLDLARVLAAGVDQRFEVETFVSGPMHIVDGLVLDGRVAFRVPSSYVNDCLSFQRDEFIGIVHIPGDDPLHDRLTSFADRVLDALPLPEATTFHMEMWLTPDDELVFCEVASRTGGLRINQALALAHGVDMDREWFRAQVGLPPDVPPLATTNPVTSCVGQVGIYPRHGTLAALPETKAPEAVVSQHLYSAVGQRHYGGYKSGDFLATFVLRAPGRDHAIDSVRAVASWFEGETRWDPHLAMCP
jgi:biotin carboxylase